MTGDDRSDPFSDMINLFAAPLAGTIRSFEQFRKGVDEFLRGVENFNRTMENLNETAERINVLLAEVEEPIKAAIPQVTRAVKAADEMMQVVSGPAIAVAPGLTRLAEMLSTPGFNQLPNQLSQFTEVMTEMSKRLGPLTQFAESAGGLFGGFRIPGMPQSRPAPSAPGAHDVVMHERTVTHEPAQEPAPADPPARKKPPARKAAARKAPAKKAPAKRSAAKKSARNGLISGRGTASTRRGRAVPCHVRRRRHVGLPPLPAAGTRTRCRGRARVRSCRS